MSWKYFVLIYTSLDETYGFHVSSSHLAKMLRSDWTEKTEYFFQEIM